MKLALPAREKIIQTSEEDVPPQRYYSINPLVKYVYRKRLESAVNFLDENCDNMLEIGCGSGILIPTLRKYSSNVYAMDIHDKLDIVKKNIKSDFIKGTIVNIPFKNKTIDCVICLSVLEHIKDLRKALYEIANTLTRQGKVIFGIPSDNFFAKIWIKLKHPKLPILGYHINKTEFILNEIGKAFSIERKRVLKIGIIDFYTVVECHKNKESMAVSTHIPGSIGLYNWKQK